MKLNYIKNSLTTLGVAFFAFSTSQAHALTAEECLDQVPENVRNQLPQECRSSPNPNLCGKPLNIRESLIETNPAVLKDITLRKVLERAATTASLADSEEAYLDLWASFQNEQIAWFGRQRPLWCDRETNEQGQNTRNGYPVQCFRPEGWHIIPGDFDKWKPIAAVNRFDMATTDGKHCGEQRLIFANNERRRSLLIIENEIPNPKPSQGIDACAPVAQFWALLSGKSTTARKKELKDAFINGHTFLQQHGFETFVAQQHLTHNTGQIRVNTFDTNPWTLRELKLVAKDKVIDGQPNKVLGAVSVPVASNMFGELLHDERALKFVTASTCQEAMVNSVDTLLDSNPNTMGAVYPTECLAAESADDGINRLPNQLVENGALWKRIETKLAASGSAANGLTPSDIVRRAHFATNCIGCHRQASTNLGNSISIPAAPAFVHVSELDFEDCGDGQQCHAISNMLKQLFLPHRKQVLDTALCALTTDRQVAARLMQRTTAPSGPARTLGGKLVGSAH